ncbi:MAG: hypothetical protein GY715_14255 [Planctomycetes bacterium]|nr:hypothetical protein [Planctomycetota bacterium]
MKRLEVENIDHRGHTLPDNRTLRPGDTLFIDEPQARAMVARRPKWFKPVGWAVTAEDAEPAPPVEPDNAVPAEGGTG